MDEFQVAEFPRKMLIIPSTVGLLIMVAVGIIGHGMPEFAVWPMLGCFAIVALIEVIAVPPAIWRLTSRPQLRTAKNLLSISVAMAFLVFMILQFLVESSLHA